MGTVPNATSVPTKLGGGWASVLYSTSMSASFSFWEMSVFWGSWPTMYSAFVNCMPRLSDM